MRNTKKILLLATVLVIFALGLGCPGSNNTNDNSKKANTAASPEANTAEKKGDEKKDGEMKPDEKKGDEKKDGEK